MHLAFALLLAGWPVSAPEQQGLDPERLQAADAYIRAECPTRYSFLIVRHGNLVWERYYHGMSQDRPGHVMSISKSVLSLLIGQALAGGQIPNLDRKLADYFPEYLPASADPRKRQITLRHLLTMTAGLEWNEAETAHAWVVSKDWYRHIIDLPAVAAPGEAFTYNTGLSHLLAGVLARATHESPVQFAQRNLFTPMGITNFRWDSDPRGNPVGGFHMHFTSRDLAKFGYLALRGGEWDGRQLVPRAWIEESTAVQMKGTSALPIGDYGYHWWTREIAGKRVFMAAGFGGQYIFVVPALDLVVVTTAEPVSDPPERHRQAFRLLTEYVLPSARPKPAVPPPSGNHAGAAPGRRRISSSF